MRATSIVLITLLLLPEFTAVADRVSREQAIHLILDDYCVLDCSGYLRSHSKYYRRTFRRALTGDMNALHRVFRDPRFHSGDNEAWCGVPGNILYVLGDTRFADFVLSLRPEERHWALTYIPVSAAFFYPDPSRGLAFFRRQFPRTYELYAIDVASRKT